MSDEEGANMNNFLSTICGFAQSNDFYSIVTFLCEKERTGEIVLYAGTYSLETALEHSAAMITHHFTFTPRKIRAGIVFI